MNKYRYSLFGLQMVSELALPELYPGSEPADVVIRRGRVPDELPEARTGDGFYQAAPGKLRLVIEGTARFLVTEGSEIVVEADPDADEKEVRVFLLGSAMGALLLQRGVLPLHASAIESAGHCIVFAGDSGQGKSTLAAAFHQAGYRVLTDDVLAVREREGAPPEAYPAYPQLKLWAEAVDKLGIRPERLRPAYSGTEKSCLPTGEEVAPGPLPISHVYVLDTSEQERLELEPIEGAAKLGVLVRHTYRAFFLEGLGGRQRHFRLCAALSRHARVARVVRPQAEFRLAALVRLLEKDF